MARSPHHEFSDEISKHHRAMIDIVPDYDIQFNVIVMAWSLCDKVCENDMILEYFSVALYVCLHSAREHETSE